MVLHIAGPDRPGVTARLAEVIAEEHGRLVDIGNVRLVGMTRNDIQKMFQLRFDDAGKQIYMWPDDIVQNTILAFAVSPTSASGYANAAPSGRYFAPANGPDCIETVPGKGDCGTGSLVLTGPTFKAHDIRFSKRTDIVGRTNIEFAAEFLNAFNHPNFLPVTGFTNSGNGTNSSATIAGYQLTGLQGTNQARVIQLVFRVNW